MDWIKVNSSHLYMIKKEGQDLYIKFKDLSTYKYHGAWQEFIKLQSVGSVGIYFNRNIRNKYKFKKIN